MPCKKCRSEFNVFNWKIKCGECDDKYCTKCLKKNEGVFYCEKCMILLKRPPDRNKLMELKSKDLQDYLNKNNVSTYGLVEKHELVDLFCNVHIPDKPKRGVGKLTANFASPVPNIRPHLNDFFENIETIFESRTSRLNRSNQTTPSNTASPVRTTPPEPSVPPPRPPSPPPPPAEPQPTSSTANEQPETTTNDVPTPATEPKVEKPTPEGSPLPPKYPKLSDFESADDLTNLTSKQLKQLLTLNRVDFKGCIEKTELLDKAKRLWTDNYEQKKELSENVEDLCKLCMDAPLDCVLLECGHIATCIDCGKKLAECPICRQYVIRVVRTFKA